MAAPQNEAAVHQTLASVCSAALSGSELFGQGDFAGDARLHELFDVLVAVAVAEQEHEFGDHRLNGAVVAVDDAGLQEL